LADIAWPAGLPTQGLLTEYEAGQVFNALGVQTAQAQLVSEKLLTHSVPYPVVVKVSSRDIPHKTEAGGVKVGVGNTTELETAVKAIAQSAFTYAPQAKLDGFLVQAMESRLLELILGYRNDPLVGPTIILGAGGITAEISPDFAIRLAPVTLAQAHAMINEVRITQLIKGFRGLPKGDCEALAQAVVAFSKLAAIKDVNVLEAEINPLFVQANKVLAVDGLVKLS
jgi:succinyl-CoA synthetase beta subunit